MKKGEISMRKRNVQILFRLNEEEAERFNRLVEKTGYSREAFLRAMILGYRLSEKPNDEFYKKMRELSAIGSRVNQIAIKANALDFIDASMLRDEATRWRAFQLEVQKRFLLPVKGKSDGCL